MIEFHSHVRSGLPVVVRVCNRDGYTEMEIFWKRGSKKREYYPMSQKMWNTISDEDKQRLRDESWANGATV